MQAQRNVSGPIRQQEQQVSWHIIACTKCVTRGVIPWWWWWCSSPPQALNSDVRTTATWCKNMNCSTFKMLMGTAYFLSAVLRHWGEREGRFSFFCIKSGTEMRLGQQVLIYLTLVLVFYSKPVLGQPTLFEPSLCFILVSMAFLRFWYKSLLFIQVARTITNMQQQIQQHQRQLYQALLMKQQQLSSHSSSSSSSAGLHPPGGPVSSKSILDPFAGSHQAPGLADSLHTKEPPSSPNAYNTYPLCKSDGGST